MAVVWRTVYQDLLANCLGTPKAEKVGRVVLLRTGKAGEAKALSRTFMGLCRPWSDQIGHLDARSGQPLSLWLPEIRYFGSKQVLLSVPIGLTPFLFAAYPAIAFIRGPLRRWRRKKPGLCQKCRYNLTGNVSGVCPECGTKITKE